MVRTTTKWIKSTFCGNAQCIEVANESNYVTVRDGKRPDAGMLQFSHENWREFLAGILAGDFPR